MTLVEFQGSEYITTRCQHYLRDKVLVPDRSFNNYITNWFMYHPSGDVENQSVQKSKSRNDKTLNQARTVRIGKHWQVLNARHKVMYVKNGGVFLKCILTLLKMQCQSFRILSRFAGHQRPSWFKLTSKYNLVSHGPVERQRIFDSVTACVYLYQKDNRKEMYALVELHVNKWTYGIKLAWSSYAFESHSPLSRLDAPISSEVIACSVVRVETATVFWRRRHGRLGRSVHRCVSVVIVVYVQHSQRWRRGQSGCGWRRRRWTTPARGGWRLADDENTFPVADVVWHDVQLVPRRPPGAWTTHSTQCSSQSDSTFWSVARILFPRPWIVFPCRFALRTCELCPTLPPPPPPLPLSAKFFHAPL